MSVTIELSEDQQHQLDRDAKIYKITLRTYPAPINHFLTKRPSPRLYCDVPEDFLEKFPRWNANIVTGPV